MGKCNCGHCTCGSKDKTDPTSPKYAEKIKNKANEATPQEDPSPTKHI